MREPTLLIVEDEPHLRELYRSEFSEDGFQVLMASNGEEAIAVLEKTLPDVIVLDIQMPEMDGIEALGKIVARFKGIPIIIHSAYTSYQDDFRSWAADAYVVKSSDLTKLKSTVSKLLEKKKS